jgi:hypothetical protein|tara:strand:+ start:468 stop:779 length:312 start_codon:yes stop_codon:yes gene_type:complete
MKGENEMSKDKDFANHIRNLMLKKRELVEYRGYDIRISKYMDAPFESCNVVTGVKKYGYDIIDEGGEIVESDHDTYEGSMYDTEACIENAKADIDVIINERNK